MKSTDRRAGTWAALGVFLLALASVGVVAQPQTKPVRVIQGPMRPTGDIDLARFFGAADVVVHARVASIRAADRNVGPSEDPATVVETAFDLIPVQVFRSVMPEQDLQPMRPLIIPHIGDRDRGSHTDRYVNPASGPLIQGRDYLLFLRRRATGEGWTLVRETGLAVFEIRGSAVVPHASAPNAMKIAGGTWASLKEELTQLARLGR